MLCFECAVPAVAVCTTCGAAVCRGCVRVGVHPVEHHAVFSSADAATTETRQLACPGCAAALATRHAGGYRFAALPEAVPDMQ
ncbi:B-box zinc finger protein [Amycolatopsis nalaikhensis]|uniref:B-box zinc finger protein n=1 Tax=Amycolatopsis nalaikhensis TaxID=715472 RepID=A0ABY8XU10_9PSEU|nr:B-box zinc finger protein [Amycolatopsis sp. 2-2]WIV59138.1 B-box zinc finger protein [Amycolatopsis sp. 2-2]